MGKVVLLTGGNGFMAPFLAKGLQAADWEVVVQARRFSSVRKSLFESSVSRFIECPLTVGHLLELVPSCHSIVHLGGSFYSESTSELIENNLTTTCEVLDFARERKVFQLLFMSTASVWSGQRPEKVREETAPDPSTSYGLLKFAAEELVRRAVNLGQVNRAVTLRCSGTYGAGSTQGVIANFIKRMHDGLPLQIHGDGQQVREPLYIDDLVRLILSVFEDQKNQHGFRAYGVSGPEKLTILQIAELVCKAMNKPLEIEWLPESSDHSRHLQIDTSKVERDFDWKPEVLLECTIAGLASQQL